ncbi:MAG TPA: hypothetical protein K8V56_18985 [Sporosarcina psychrophila]|uniref:Uncharacterized protein n=1 Tax=Sporosarcina psychrophila TaxID=1476 RepID=A0A921G3E5_SPOPS|nr:hypothetical protein [Sporosarcina psychrophila]
MRIEDVYFKELSKETKGRKKKEDTFGFRCKKVLSRGFELISSILNRMRT